MRCNVNDHIIQADNILSGYSRFHNKIDYSIDARAQSTKIQVNMTDRRELKENRKINSIKPVVKDPVYNQLSNLVLESLILTINLQEIKFEP